MALMLRILFILLFTLYQLEAAPLRLQDKFMHAQEGAYIVTAHDQAYSLLLLRSLTSDVLLLEEISIPAQQVDLKQINWKKWLAEKAPGHTSWTLYEIDLNQGTLMECFSLSKNGWIYLDEQEQFFVRLLTLPFSPLAPTQRKKIGPAPQGEDDHRKPWNPSLIRDGKKDPKPTFDVVHTQWPEDRTLLSLCDVELYFDAKTSFPFPYWIEVKSPHYAFKVRTIESGHQLTSPFTMPMPHRSPEFLSLHKSKTTWEIQLKAPHYYKDFQLFALDLTDHSLMLPIDHLMKRDAEHVTLLINTATLKGSLHDHHRYRWVILSQHLASTFLESEETFIWEKP